MILKMKLHRAEITRPENPAATSRNIYCSSRCIIFYSMFLVKFCQSKALPVWVVQCGLKHSFSNELPTSMCICINEYVCNTLTSSHDSLYPVFLSYLAELIAFFVRDSSLGVRAHENHITICSENTITNKTQIFKREFLTAHKKNRTCFNDRTCLKRFCHRVGAVMKRTQK